MHLRVTIILIVLSSFTIRINAQAEFVLGYIITLQLDTLHGQLKYNQLNKNSMVCDFRESEEASTISYAPGEIVGYRFLDDKYYISRNMGTEEDPQIVFLEYLLDGEEVDLFFYRDAKQRNRYLLQKDTLIIELKNDMDTVYVANKIGTEYEMKLKQSRQYSGILTYAFSDQQQLWSKIKDVEFNHDDLIDITREYHELACPNGKCIIYRKEREKPQFRFFPEYTIRYTNCSVATAIDHAEQVQFPSEIKSTFSVGSEMTFPQSTRRTAVLLKVSLLRMNYTQTIEEESYRYDLAESNIGIGFSAGMKQYFVPGHKSRFYYGAWISYMKFVNAESGYRHFIINNTEVDYDYVYRDSQFGSGAGLTANLGIETPITDNKSLYLEIGYQYQAILTGVNLAGRIQNFQLSSGILF